MRDGSTRLGTGIRQATAIAAWLMLIAIIFRQTGPPSTTIRSRHLGERLQFAEDASNASSSQKNLACRNARDHFGYPDSCAFVRAQPLCQSGGLIEYTQLFFCKFGTAPWMAYSLLGLWLLALFYMLGNTAADYFCCSLQKLSELLHLPPTVAGVTLLPLGNGAPDVFASIAAFIGAEAGQVGLNSVLGGAVFVTMVVGGLVYIASAGKSLRLDRYCFIRDVSFFLFTLVCLVCILRVGKVHLWGAVAFMSIYAAYAVTVATSEIIKRKASRFNWLQMQEMPQEQAEDEEEGWYCPLTDPDDAGDSSFESGLPQWRWASHVAIYAHQQSLEDSPRPLWSWNEQQEEDEAAIMEERSWASLLYKVLLDWPLTLPRQLTIPLVEDNRWSRPVAVASATLAPLLLAALINRGLEHGSNVSTYLWGATIGLVLGLLAYLTTVREHPPRSFVFPWVAAGFLMSIVWFYLVASELVAVLVSLGVVLDVDPAVLGLTVLAWGNSMGDLMANVAMASNGGDGAQIAVSGCYAGPMFNTLIGLGTSLLLASWKSYPGSFVVPKDGSVFFTIGALVLGLVCVLIFLPSRRMQPSRGLGIALLVFYTLFLAFRLFQAVGIFSITVPEPLLGSA